MVKIFEKEAALGDITPPEAKTVTCIIDMENRALPLLEKVNASNIDAIIESGCQQIEQRRQKIQNFTPDFSMAEIVSTKQIRADYAHAIQCALNPAIDSRGYLAALSVKDFPLDNADAQYIRNFFTENIHQ